MQMNDEQLRNAGYVQFWWQRDEFASQREEWQAEACLEIPGADLLQDDASVASMQQTPLGEPDTDFSVRATYDSRFINSYDFNFTQEVTETGGGAFVATFNVPQGYRAVPRKWEVLIDPPTLPNAVFNMVSLLANGAGVPNNQNIVIGAGGTEGNIDSFYVVEEQTTFGMSLNLNSSGGAIESFIIVKCYGQLIAVNENALPFAIANQTKPSGGLS